MVKEIAAEQKAGCIDLRLAQQEPGDLIGLPRREEKRTIWSLPEWWPQDPDSKGILFLDELNRAPVDVRQSVFQLVTEWQLHTHRLPPGWAIVSAINPDTGAYQVESLDIAMLRRFCQVEITPAAGEWVKWAQNYGIDDRIVKFIRANKKMLVIEEDCTIEAKPTPEGYRLIDELLKNSVIPKGLQYEVFAGLIGRKAAAALKQSFGQDLTPPVSGSEITGNYGEVRERALAQPNDRMYSTNESLVEVLLDGGKSLSQEQLANVTAYLKDLPEEWKMSVLTALADAGDLLQRLSRDLDLNRAILKVVAEIERPVPGKGRRKGKT